MFDNIRENIFVMTRDLMEDYRWFCKPSSCVNVDNLIPEMEKIFMGLRNDSTFTSQWYCINLKDNKIVFRIVVDGRKDICGRLIRRYEGSIIKDNNPNEMLKLEKYLLEKQKETNNYNYGFNSLLSSEKRSVVVKVSKRSK